MSAKKAYDYSIRLLSRRDYSRFKLKQKLVQREHTEEEIDEVIQKLTEQKYLREEEYKRMRVKSLILKGYANKFIQLKLEKEDLYADDVFIDQIRLQSDSPTDEIVDQLIQKKLRGKTIPEDYEAKMKLKNKVLNFLISKGHNYQKIKDQVGAHFNDQSYS